MEIVNLSLPAKSNPEKSIREHTDDLLFSLNTLYNLGYIKDEKLYSLCKIACEFHDYGKINSDFQKRLITKEKFDALNEIAHNILSIFFIDDSLFSSKVDYAIVINAVLNHHNYQNNIEYLENNKEKIKNKLIDYNAYEIKSSVIKKVKDIRNTDSAIFVQGILYRCDYSASGDIPIEFPNNFLENALENHFDKWKTPDKKDILNDLQIFCKNHQKYNLIITAPTGMGKTEASLLWLGNNKGFYILPLKTAINSMYARICNMINNEKLDQRVALLHSDNLSIVSKFENQLDVFDYVNLSKNFSLPITVSTPDQIFNFVFKYPSYELKLATLSYSKVIIDEIQAYDAELLAYIINGIHQIIKMGGQVGIFTATLAPFILHFLNSPYEETPFINADFSKNNNKHRHNVKVIETEIDTAVIVEKFMQKSTSNKILVVCNTVNKAQEIFKKLCGEVGDENVKLLHAKFIKKDRSLKEKEILADGQTDVNKSIIWVSTQIVEASLDIDFDFIFTELSELNGLFQRFGRCNRKGVKKIDSYNCFVYTEIPKELLISKIKEKGFIDKDIHEKSKNALASVDGVLSEEDKINLLNTYFSYENLKSSEYVKKYKKTYKYIDDLFIGGKDVENADKRFRKFTSRVIIPENVYNENHNTIHNALNILKDKEDKSYKEKLIIKQKAKNIIEQYCVGVNPWDIDNNTIVGEINLNKFTKIEVVNCNYNNNIGFQKNDKTKPQSNGIFL